MPEDKRKSRVSSILRKAEKLAYDCGFALHKADWLYLRAKFKEILDKSGFDLSELEESRWTDDDIISILQDIKQPSGSFPYVVEDLSALRDSALHAVGMDNPFNPLREQADIDLTKGVADYLKELKKNHEDKRRKRHP